MNLLSWVLLIAVAAGFAAAVVYLIRHKGCCSCAGGCQGCSCAGS